jgi:hypothetical protein
VPRGARVAVGAALSIVVRVSWFGFCGVSSRSHIMAVLQSKT